MFCENCGKSIANNLFECPYCRQATGVVAASGSTGAAAVAVKAPIAVQNNSGSKLSRVEQGIYFRFARGFSWFLLIVITLGIIRIVISLGPVVAQTFGSSTAVSPQELGNVNPAQMRSPGEEQEEIDPSLMARLDQTAYEIIQLIPANERQYNSIDNLRTEIRNSAANLTKEQKEQLGILEELRDDLKALPEGRRGLTAVNAYFAVKDQKIRQDRAKKEEAKQNLTILGASLFSAIALLTFVTMILVLLSIERTTRLSMA
ncbi:MAG TPA: hypothetical protein VFR24_12485 [Candidatus Angelobacter sp.]|nr:hypothetical protein [Candidatus Angelobacter sp.]